MLKEAMLAVRATDNEYAPEIRDLLEAAKKDLELAGVIIQGDVDIEITEDAQTGEITTEDSSTIEDQLVIRAMITYVRCHFGDPTNYDRLAASYDLQRKQLANGTGYTDFLEEAEDT